MGAGHLAGAVSEHPFRTIPSPDCRGLSQLLKIHQGPACRVRAQSALEDLVTH